MVLPLSPQAKRNMSTHIPESMSKAWMSYSLPLRALLPKMDQARLRPAIQRGTRVLISLWDSLMFGQVLKRS